MQYGFNYRIPLYEQASSVSFFYTHSDVNTGTIAHFSTGSIHPTR